jgi:two-component system sensor histidine kinase KdpD
LSRKELSGLLFGLAGIGMVTWAFVGWLDISNSTTAALSYFVVLLFIARVFSLWVALGTTIAAALALDYFFFPPIGVFNISDPQDWIAFSSFLVASVIASQLSSLARRREAEAIVRRGELGRLFELSRDVLLVTDGPDGLGHLTNLIHARFLFRHVRIDVAGPAGLEHWEAGAIDASATQSTDVRLERVPNTVATLTVAGGFIDPSTLSLLASLIAIAVERVHLLSERHSAELAQRSVEMKSVLMASLAHDLQTPLTAIRLAVENLDSPLLSDAQRSGQAGIARGALDQLSRLFRNILEMTRIDAGHVAPDLQWVMAAELAEAARRQVAHALHQHTIAIVDHCEDRLVHVDPRLTSAALAHVLDNAAQYSPPRSRVLITLQVTDDGLHISVRDEGSGIAAADAPRLFERFYRGRAASAHSPGTGMGLAIARGLLAAEGGSIFADNHPAGGAEVSIVVPAGIRDLEDLPNDPVLSRSHTD